MNEIRCPKCGEAFKVDASGLADIVRQVRDKEFQKELLDRENIWNADKEKSVALAVEQTEKALMSKINEFEIEKAKLTTKLESTEKEEKLAIRDALSTKEDEIIVLKRQIEEQKAALELEVSRKDSVIEGLHAQMKNQELSNQLETQKIIADVEKERDQLKGIIELKDTEKQLSEKSLKESYESKITEKNEQIAYYKDFKAKQSTKMVGESLEQHCQIEFNRMRATAFKNASFEKDSEVKEGGKGDYIYREYDADNNEIVSIMFDMKTELDETATKKKNEDFLDKLNKDREAKNCEYAVLVSLLELDNDFYNSGIADVSYRYEKMYVVRPQSFISMITILRDSAIKSMNYKSELALIKNQNLDVTNFESDLEAFKQNFSRNCRLANERFLDAIAGIDKTMIQLQKIRDALVASDKNLRIANEKADDLTIKKLTRGNVTMTAKFDELKKENQEKNTD